MLVNVFLILTILEILEILLRFLNPDNLVNLGNPAWIYTMDRIKDFRSPTVDS